MKLSEANRKVIGREFRFVATRLRDGAPSAEKIWYLSATYGMTNRVLNIEYDPELHLLDTVLSGVYSNLRTRDEAIRAGDPSVTIPDEVFSRLSEVLEQMADRVEGDKQTVDLIQRLVPLGYVATGNGYYLWKKKAMPI